MLSRRILAAAFGLATVLPCVPALADPGPDTRSWLARVHEAASVRNYQGVQVVTAGGAVASSRIAHYGDGNEQLERVDMLSGPMRRVFRHNDTVVTIWPQRQLAVVEERDRMLPPFPAILEGSAERLVEHYALVPIGKDRLAGYDTDVFLLKPRDALRYGQRLWAEKSSGLLLRADVVGFNGEVLESAAFSEIDIGVRPEPDSVLQPMKKLDGYRVVHATVTPTQLDTEGWSLAQPAAGFQQVRCVKRPLDLANGEAGGEAPANVLQTVFSDGLTHVSIFIEPYDARRHHPMMTVMGATHTLMLRRGDSWVTLVGDVPTPTLRQFAVALERRK